LSTIDIIPTTHDQSRRFDRTHGKGAFVRLRSMLADPAFLYQHIGSEFGVTRQYIAQLENLTAESAGIATLCSGYLRTMKRVERRGEIKREHENRSARADEKKRQKS